jgi:hypothetical protein
VYHYPPPTTKIVLSEKVIMVVIRELL